MFDQILVGVQCHLYEIIGKEEEEEVFQARNMLPLLASMGKITANGIPQEPLTEWMKTIGVLFKTTMALKNISSVTISFLTC